LSTELTLPGQSPGRLLETTVLEPDHHGAAARHHDAAASPARLDFEELYEEHFSLAWRTARRLGVPERALDDVVQDVFLVVHRRLAEFDGRVAVKYWILGIVTRVVADHRRSFWRKDARCVPPLVDKDGAEAQPSTFPAPLEQAEQAEALRLVASLLDELDREKREVLVLAQFEEMTAVEISDCLAVNVNTVYARLRAAKKAFDAAYARHRARTERRFP
jgi:RNA polymerase sigma-70 factor (ECF subfamily)